MSRRINKPRLVPGLASQNVLGSWANRTLAYLAWLQSSEERLRWKAECMRLNGGELTAEEKREDDRRRLREAEMFAAAFPEENA